MTANRPQLAKRTTLKDVARDARVARTTVSAILNDAPTCYASTETRQRVVESARKLGYRPNMLARGLLGQATQTIGLVLPNLRTEMTGRKFTALEFAAREAGYVTITTCNDGRLDLENRAIEWLQDRHVDGMVVYPSPRGPHSQLERLCESDFPVVTFDGAGLLDFPTWDITADYVVSGRLAMQHLIDLGRSRVGIVGVNPSCWVNDRKIEGMHAALAEAGLEPASVLMVDRPADNPLVTDDIRNQLRRWLTEHRQLDGAVFVGDLIALNGIRAAYELGIRVPEDLAIVGHDGIDAADVGAIPLTTVVDNAEDAGRMAFEMLHQRIQGKLSGPPQRKLRTAQLVARASSISSNVIGQPTSGAIT